MAQARSRLQIAVDVKYCFLIIELYDPKLHTGTKFESQNVIIYSDKAKNQIFMTDVIFKYSVFD